MKFLSPKIFAPVRALNTHTFPGLSPTQSSVTPPSSSSSPRCTVNTPSGPDLSLLAVPSGFNTTPANSPWAMCVMLLSLGSTISISLLLRSARKYFLRFGSNQLISKETRLFVPAWMGVSPLRGFVCGGWAEGGPRHSQHGKGADRHSCHSLFFRYEPVSRPTHHFSPFLFTAYDSPRIKARPKTRLGP